MVNALIDSGAIALLAIAIIAIEILVIWYARPLDRAAFAANGLSGILLLASLGLSLSGFGSGWIAAALGLSLFAHIVYLALRRRT